MRKKQHHHTWQPLYVYVKKPGTKRKCWRECWECFDCKQKSWAKVPKDWIG